MLEKVKKELPAELDLLNETPFLKEVCEIVELHSVDDETMLLLCNQLVSTMLANFFAYFCI